MASSSHSDPLADQIDWFEAYMRDERRASPNTLRAYGRDLHELYVYAQANALPLDAARLDVACLRAFLAEISRRCSVATLARKVAAVRAFYRFL
jgi:integrase/recombinase XerC